MSLPYPSPRPPAHFALQNDKSIYIYTTRSFDLLQEPAMACYLQNVLRQCDIAEGRVCSRASARGLYGEQSDHVTRLAPSTTISTVGIILKYCSTLLQPIISH
jgi:hypothetical protein